MDERFKHYTGPVQHDFGGESHLVDGEWVRQPFTLSDKERRMYSFYGRLMKKIRDIKNQKGTDQTVE